MLSILDSTLREGEQMPGVYFPEHVKLEIARQLDKVGVQYIEAGHPLVSREIYKAVKRLSEQDFKCRVGAHSRCFQEDVDLALECGVKFLGIFYCVSQERLQAVFKTNLSSALRRITEVISYAKGLNPDLLVRFTPEDTVRSKYANVLAAVTAAVEAGADIISIADTTGYMRPSGPRSMYDYVKRFKEDLAARNLHPALAVHCHNDLGLALANALEGYRAGAEIIDASVLGLGERAGIVDLAVLLAVLAEQEDQKLPWDLPQLPKLYEMVSKYAKVAIPEHAPVMGKNAFKHCAGVHTHAACKDPLHYQSLDPRKVGREMEITLDHMAGLSSVRYGLEQIGAEDLDRQMQQQVLSKVKEVGQTGRTVDLDEFRLIVNWVKEDYEQMHQLLALE